MARHKKYKTVRPRNPKPKKIKHYETLNETHLGITQYMSKCPGFVGIIKSRINDFHVNEIDKKGNVVKLTDLTAPEIPKEQIIQGEDVVDTETYLVANNLLTIDEWNAVKEIIHTKQPYTIDATKYTKLQRKHIHAIVKNYFNCAIITSTENKIMKFTFKKENSKY